VVVSSGWPLHFEIASLDPKTQADRLSPELLDGPALTWPVNLTGIIPATTAQINGRFNPSAAVDILR
jgi:hypothetical protein